MNLFPYTLILGAVLALGATLFQRDARAAAGTATTVAAEPAVTLYVAPGCGFCARARALLDSKGVTYVERDIEDAVVNADWRALGGQGVPLLVVGEQRVQGFDPQRIEAALATLPAGD